MTDFHTANLQVLWIVAFQFRQQLVAALVVPNSTRKPTYTYYAGVVEPGYVTPILYVGGMIQCTTV